MDQIEDNQHLSTSISSKASSILTRSLTSKPLLSSPALDRTLSMKKWYNSFESTGDPLKGKVRQLRTLFESPQTLILDSSSLSSSKLLSNRSFNCNSKPDKSISPKYKDNYAALSILESSRIRFQGTEDRVVVYFTSLRGIRRTFEDCYAVRMMLRGFNVFVDERDVSMDWGYRKELQGLMGEKCPSLPQVFIKGRYVGGVDVIRQLNETGELRKILQLLPTKDRRFGCDACGDLRFLPCSNCSGSKKLFDEDEGVMKRCFECNENGLSRCPECCL